MLEESAEDGPRFGGMEAIDKHYKDIGGIKNVRKRGGWLAALFVGEMLTASAVQHDKADLARAVCWSCSSA
jgi:magnesium transporter